MPLWFAVRLYAITLPRVGTLRNSRCGLRSGYMRLHSNKASSFMLLSCGLRSGYMRLH